MTASASNAASPLVGSGSWTLDSAVSTVGFRMRHFGVATVEGRLTRFAGSISAGARAAASTSHRSTGQLTIRDITRPLRVQLACTDAAEGALGLRAMASISRRPSASTGLLSERPDG